MSQVRVHNFSISLDGFGTGDGITFDAPFGHAGERLHEWMFATRFWRSMVGDAGGTAGVDNSFAERHGLGIGAEIMGRGKFGVQTGPWTDVGTDERLPRRRPHRHAPRRAGTDPARPRRAPLGRGRGRRGALRHRQAVSSPSGVTHLTFTRR